MSRAIRLAARMALTASLPLASALLTACAPRADMDQMQNSQFETREMLASDHQAIHALDERMRRLEDQIQEMSHGGAEQGPTAPPNKLAGISSRLSKLEAQVGALQSSVPPPVPPPNTPPGGAPAFTGSEPGASAPPAVAPGAIPPATIGPTAGSEGAENSNAATEGGAGETEEGEKTGAGLSPGGAAAESAGTETANAGGEAPAAVPPEAAPAVPSPKWPQELDRAMQDSGNDRSTAGRLYRGGLMEMKAGHYGVATEKFNILQKKYPRSGLNEGAAYFSANALYEQGKYEESILHFHDLATRFPRGRYSGEALLRESQAFLKINDKVDARMTLQKLINEHADAPEASAAKSMIKDLETD